ncbi:MAG: GIY-YIG nuclease family protein [Planctomycetaceae bacterium]|nr:GIY-YIG nuclease family protein [Planctomycetaceae bacterium]
MKVCYVYIMASQTGTLYTGIASNLVRRVIQHQDHQIPGFTSRYNVNKLLYYERLDTPAAAIKREKQIKA